MTIRCFIVSPKELSEEVFVPPSDLTRLKEQNKIKKERIEDDGPNLREH